MGTSTWAVIRPLISRPFGVVEFTLTTAIAASKVLISTELEDDYPKDDYFVGWYAKVTTFLNAGTTRRVTAYLASTGQLTVAGQNLTSDSANKAKVELHRFHPDRMLNHFNEAARDLFPLISVLRDAQSVLVTGQNQRFYTLPSTVERRPLQVWEGMRTLAASIEQNEVTDPGFEDWTSATALNSWALVGAGSSVNQEAASTPNNHLVLEGSNSALIKVADSTVTTLLQTVTPTVGVEGAEANFSIWVYSKVASRIAARCGGTDGDTHTGTGWELLHAAEIQSSTATTVSVGVSVTSGAVIGVYVDEAVLVLGQSERISGGWTPLMNWTYVPQVLGASAGSLSTGPTLQVVNPLSPQHRLRVVYQAALNTLSADTDTVEIDGEVLQVVLAETRAKMAEEAAGDAPPAQRDSWINSAGIFHRVADGLLNKGVGSPTVPMTPRIPGM